MNKKTCFVIQPFKEPYNTRYDQIYKPAIEAAGLTPYRVDEDVKADFIVKKIEEEISASHICFAEISERNPNVWYELGFACARGKPVVMVCDRSDWDKLPFDIKHRQVFSYYPKDDGKNFEKKITEALTERAANHVPRDDNNPLSAHSVCNSIRNGKKNAIGKLREYFSVFPKEMDQFSIDDNTPDFAITMQNVKDFLPYRDEIVKVFLCIARYLPEQDAIKEIHRFFGSALFYYDIHRNRVAFPRRTRVDNFKFLVHEMFLYAVAALVKCEKFEHVKYLMNEPYYTPGIGANGDMSPLEYIWQPTEAWGTRNTKLNLNKVSLRADAIIERVNDAQGLTRSDILQADMILALKSHSKENLGMTWYPEIMLACPRDQDVFEIFAKAQSREYFNNIKILWNIGEPHHLNSAIRSIITDLSGVNGGRLAIRNIDSIVNLKNLCKIP